VSKLVGKQITTPQLLCLQEALQVALLRMLLIACKTSKPRNTVLLFMQMFAWIKLRWRQAFLTRDVKCFCICMLRWYNALQRLASLGRRRGPEKLTKRYSLAFPVYFFEGSALGKRVRLLIRDIEMYFCFASIPLRNNLNSAPSRRF
jgi:hypothetical protein